MPRAKRETKYEEDLPRKKLLRRPPIFQAMLEDEARARIELGLYRISQAMAPRQPLTLRTSKQFARDLGIPERHLGLVLTTIRSLPQLHMAARVLSGGLWRIDFRVGYEEDRQMVGQQATAGMMPQDMTYIEPIDPVACGTFMEPEVERTTGWERIVRDEE